MNSKTLMSAPGRGRVVAFLLGALLFCFSLWLFLLAMLPLDAADADLFFSRVQFNSAIRATEYTVSNTGPDDIGSYTVLGQWFTDEAMTILSGSFTVFVSDHPSGTGLQYTTPRAPDEAIALKLTIDSADAVAETDETNNVRTQVGSEPAQGPMVSVINELFVHPGNPTMSPEAFLELRNPQGSGEPISVLDWAVQDQDGNRFVIVDSAVNGEGDGAFITMLYGWPISEVGLSFLPEGGFVAVFDDTGREVTRVTYDGTGTSGQSFARTQNGDFLWTDFPTPGYSNIFDVNDLPDWDFTIQNLRVENGFVHFDAVNAGTDGTESPVPFAVAFAGADGAILDVIFDERIFSGSDTYAASFSLPQTAEPIARVSVFIDMDHFFQESNEQNNSAEQEIGSQETLSSDDATLSGQSQIALYGAATTTEPLVFDQSGAALFSVSDKDRVAFFLDPNDPSVSSLTINGEEVLNATDPPTYFLLGGNNLFEIMVTAQNGTSTQNYAVTISATTTPDGGEEPPPDDGGGGNEQPPGDGGSGDTEPPADGSTESPSESSGSAPSGGGGGGGFNPDSTNPVVENHPLQVILGREGAVRYSFEDGAVLEIIVPAGAVSENMIFTASQVPVSDISMPGGVGISLVNNQGFFVRAVNGEQEEMHTFREDLSFTITMPENVVPQSADPGVYRYDENANIWIRIPHRAEDTRTFHFTHAGAGTFAVFLASGAPDILLIGSPPQGVLGERVVSCPLGLESVYKTTAHPAVWFITLQCTRRLFLASPVYFTYFDSWGPVRVVSAQALTAVPVDTLGFMPWGPFFRPSDGALLKTVEDPKVYLISGSAKHWIENRAVFEVRFGADAWQRIQDVDPRVLGRFPVGALIRENP